MLQALRVALPVLTFYYVVLASIVVDQQSSLEGLAFIVFAVGLIPFVYERIFHVVAISGAALLNEYLWAFILPTVFPLIRWWLGGDLNYQVHAVEVSIYLLIPTFPFLIEWLVYEKNRDVFVSMCVLLIAHLIQIVWFVFFLVSNRIWVLLSMDVSWVVYLSIFLVVVRAWTPPIHRIKEYFNLRT